MLTELHPHVIVSLELRCGVLQSIYCLLLAGNNCTAAITVVRLCTVRFKERFAAPHRHWLLISSADRRHRLVNSFNFDFKTSTRCFLASG